MIMQLYLSGKNTAGAPSSKDLELKNIAVPGTLIGSVYAPGGVRSGAAAAFEYDTRHTIKFTFGTGGGIQKQVAAGAPADATVIPRAGVTEVERGRGGLVAPNSRLEVGSVGVEVGIEADTPGRSVHPTSLLAARGKVDYDALTFLNTV